MKIDDVGIIGAGPAGLTAAIQLKRTGYDPVVFEKGEIGGLLRNASVVENYPGFPEGISGPDLVSTFRDQAERWKVRVLRTGVDLVKKNDDHFTIMTDDGVEHSFRKVIIASGTEPRTLDLDGASSLAGRYLFYEVADLLERFDGGKVLVVGGGDAAFDYAVNLGSRGFDVSVIVRGSVKCLPLLLSRAKKESIPIIRSREIMSIGPGRKGLAISHMDPAIGEDGTTETVEVDAVLAAVGRLPSLTLLGESLLREFIEQGEDSGIYLAGDIRRGDFRQVGISVGDGLMAAMKIAKVLGESRLPIDVLEEGSNDEREEVPVDPLRSGSDLFVHKSHGNDDLARVYVGSFGEDGRKIEFVESVQPPVPREDKWVLIVSTLFGCPVGCAMCDAGKDFSGKLTKEEIWSQAEHMIAERYPDMSVPVPKLKVQFARMGDPALNPAVIELMRELPVRMNAPGLMPCISTIAPKASGDFFEELLKVKDELYGEGRFQMQFSIHSTSEDERDEIMPIRKWSMREIAAYGERFFKPGDRKIALNFAPAKGWKIDPYRLRDIFDPERFLVKITPLNPTESLREAGLESLVDPDDPGSAEELVKGFEEQGFEVILSIGETRENLIGSNCGQFIS